MPRTKGSKNKAGLKRGYEEGFRGHLSKVLEKDLIKKSETLSLKSGVSLREVVNDAVAEGLTFLESDAYAEMIRFRTRRGKIVYEWDKEPSTESPGGTQEEGSLEPEETVGALPLVEVGTAVVQGRPYDVVEQRGLRPEDSEDSVVPKESESVTVEGVQDEQEQEPDKEGEPEDDLHIPF